MDASLNGTVLSGDHKQQPEVSSLIEKIHSAQGRVTLKIHIEASGVSNWIQADDGFGWPLAKG